MAKSARQRAKAKAKQAQADRQRADAEAAQAKAAAESFNTPSAFYGVSQASSDAARDYINQNIQNPTVRAAGADLAFNAFRADFQRQSDARYAKEIAPLALDYQKGAQEIASTARDREIASQGREDFRQKELEAGTRRYESDQSLAGTRYGADQSLAATRETAAASRYGADQDLAGTREVAGANRYTADQQLAGTRYVADQDLAGKREGYQSAERQIGMTGEEQRKTLRQSTEETLALRRDARGAIAGAGRRFYA